ncbi:DUF397 domain-containing protein [Streptomyces sp. 4503]|uniref:DUF397 domain-containing protein n=1 Tax=Streptomyces niphimycinicus TaxID=2842201 RepID=A0ABS6CHC8_9ACTN|nr:DUF397 domain-containing protein [Streptomyces niphimycinicus]MBU3866308.1 DUF397 domain-containing protein [Streptomyces niphimycinicus]
MTHRIASGIAPEGAWFKSSYSEANGTACVEIAHLPHTAQVGIRDSKDKSGPALVVPAGAWAEFVAAVRRG